jgi:FMN reductase
MKIVAVSASLSEESTTSRLAQRLLATAAAAAPLSTGGFDRRERCSLAQPPEKNVETELIELRPIAHGIMDAMLTGFAVGDTEAALEKVANADGLIIVTPLYTTTYSGLLKCFIDVLAGSDPSNSPMKGTPTLLAATGGTPRHSLALDYSLRPLFSYLHADVLSTVVFAATDDWAGTGDKVRPLTSRIDRAGKELVSAMLRSAFHTIDPPDVNATSSGLKNQKLANPFENTPTFEQLFNQLQ